MRRTRLVELAGRGDSDLGRRRQRRGQVALVPVLRRRQQRHRDFRAALATCKRMHAGGTIPLLHGWQSNLGVQVSRG